MGRADRYSRLGMRGRSPVVVGGGGALAPALTSIKNWWQPSGLTPATSIWLDDGSEGATLTQAFANLVTMGIPIDGKQAMSGISLGALENATTSIAAASAREVWIVLRPDNLSTQLALDGVGGTERNTLFVGATGIVTANAGTSLASATGAAPEHRPQILRVVVNGDGSGAVYRVTDVASATSSPIASGTIGSAVWTGITLGANNTGSSAWLGEIAEVLRYSAVLAGSDPATTAAYLLAKYPSAAKFTHTPVYLNCIGDSITQGQFSESGRSYRLKLFTAFETSDISPTETIIYRGTTKDRCLDHDGVSGNTIAQVEARVAADIAANAPDVMVLLAGTNDCQDAGYDGATAQAAYASLLATVNTADATLPIVVVLVPPLTNATHNANVNDLNPRIETAVAAAASTITVVDPRDAGWTTGAGYTTDGVHPNDAGETALSTVIEAGIRAAL
jgi:lysophospholipase L1-like esterase